MLSLFVETTGGNCIKKSFYLSVLIHSPRPYLEDYAVTLKWTPLLLMETTQPHPPPHL